MGFSVSGSAAIIFAAMLIGFGMFHSATTNSFEDISDAQDEQTDRTLIQQNTDMEIVSAEYDPDDDGGNLTVTVENTGSTQLSVGEVDLLGNNEYLALNRTAIDGNEGTTLWLPEEQLALIRTGLGDDPGQVKVVTGPGIAAVESTEAV